jgi:hypothetical protein
MIRSVAVVPMSRMIVPGVSSVNSRSYASALYAATGPERRDLGRQPELADRAELLHDPRPRHREDPHLDVGRVGAHERLVVPLDLLERERDLLHRLELDDVGHLLGLDRRQLREPRERLMPRHAHRKDRLRQVVLVRQRAQRHPQGVRLIQLRRRKHLRVIDHREVAHGHTVTVGLELDRLDRARTDLDSPTHVRRHAARPFYYQIHPDPPPAKRGIRAMSPIVRIFRALGCRNNRPVTHP